MNPLRLIPWFGLVLLAGPLAAESASVLTLQQAVAASQTNPRLSQAAAELAAARRDVDQAQAAFLPSWDAGVSWKRSVPQQQQDTGSGFVDAAPLDFWTLQVGAQQSLWDFGRRSAAADLAESRVKTARAHRDDTALSLAYQTALAYETTVALSQELASLAQQKADLEQHLTSVQTRANMGSATKYDVLNTQVRVSALEGERLQVALRWNQQRRRLAQFTGLSEALPLVPSLDVRRTDQSLAELTSGAVAASQSLVAASAQLAGAEADVRAAQSAWLPEVSATAAVGFQNPVLTQENQDLNRPQLNAYVGLNVGLSSLNPVQAEAREAASRHRRDASRWALNAARTDLEAAVADAYDRYTATLAAWNNARVQSELARQTLEAARAQYDLGAVGNDTYLNAHLSYEQARFAELDALVEEVSAFFALGQITGANVTP